MFVVIMEKRISSKIKKMGDPVEDWHVLVAAVLTFAPVIGTELQISEAGILEFIKLERVVYTPKDGTFWARIKPILHPKPDAKAVAEGLVDGNWDLAVEDAALVEARKKFTKNAIVKLQQILVQAQARAMISHGGNLSMLGKLPKGKRRH